jgi:putative Mg2+ transporter-C (MgtC) family protein
MSDISQVLLASEFLFRCVLSVALGGIIGLEREFRHKAAGFRTHILICLGATALTFLSIQFSYTGDPGRIAGQIVSGVGFIGGGAILHSQKMIQGLTTAATLWAAATLGMLIGGGLTLPSIAFTIICLFVLLFSSRISQIRKPRRNYTVSLEIFNPDVLDEIDYFLSHYEMSVDQKQLSRQKGLHLDLTYSAAPLMHHVFLKKLLALQGVGHVMAL